MSCARSRSRSGSRATSASSSATSSPCGRAGGRPRCDPRAPRRALLQPRDLGLRERLEREVGQRRAAPLLERRAQARRGALGQPAASARRPSSQAARSARGRARPARHAAGSRRAGHEPRGLAAERAAQPRDRRLHGLDRAVGRPLAPQVRDQTVARDRLSGTQQQQREQRALARSRDRERATFRPRLDRSEDAESPPPKLPADARERQPLSPRRKAAATAVRA